MTKNEKTETLDALENAIIRQCYSSNIHWSDMEFENIIMRRIVNPDNKMMDAARGNINGNPSIRSEFAIYNCIAKYQTVEEMISHLKFCKRNKGRSLNWAAQRLGIHATTIKSLGKLCQELGYGVDFSKYLTGEILDDEGDFIDQIDSGCYQRSGHGKLAV